MSKDTRKGCLTHAEAEALGRFTADWVVCPIRRSRSRESQSREIMARALTVILLFLGSACAQRPQNVASSGATLVLKRANIIDIENGRVVPHQTIVIVGSRIVAIGSSSEVALPTSSQVVDAAGKYIIPGLWDMHVHIPGANAFDGLTGVEFLPIYVAQGITGVRDMGADCSASECDRWMRKPGEIARLRNDISAGRLLGPRIVSPGPIVDGPNPVHQGSLIVGDADSARRVVRALGAAGAPFIKVYDRVPREAYMALADESRKLGISFVGHVPVSVSALEASDAGQETLEHLWLVLEGCSSVGPELLARRRRRDAAATRRDTTFSFAADYLDLTRRTIETYDPAVCQALALRFRENGTWMVPTNAGTWGSAMAGDSSFAHRSEFARVPRWLQNALAPFVLRDSHRAADEIEQRRRWHQHKLKIVSLMYGAGVQFLAGTDNPGAYTFPGFSLHDELALFVEAGLSPLQALQTATLLPARYLNATDSLGHVAAGKVADLVLLDANPLEDIRNTRRINAVVVNGRYFDQAALKRLLSVPAKVPDVR